MTRSPTELQRIAKELAKLYLFQPRFGETHCNAFVHCFCVALNVPMLAGLANDQNRWLSETGHGWLPIDAVAAAKRADLGFPVVASSKSLTGGHGHIVMVVPSQDGRLTVAQAGRRVSASMPIEHAFGVNVKPEFFTHD